MSKLKGYFLARLKLFLPIIIGIAFSIFVISYQAISNSKQIINKLIIENLELNVQTIINVLENENLKSKEIVIAYNENDTLKLKKILKNIAVTKNNNICIIDNKSKIVFQLKDLNRSEIDKTLIDYINENEKGIYYYNNKTIAFAHSRKLDFYVLASVVSENKLADLIKKTIVESLLTGVIIIVLLSTIVYFLTVENIRNYLKQINLSKEDLVSTKKALTFSEQKFKTIFNNSSDEIFLADLNGNFIEVNQLVCEKLGYTKTELLSMSFYDIKSNKQKPYVAKNIKKIIADGYRTYETENVTKMGKVIPVEMKSRLIDCSGTKMIISIARNISKRKAVEKQMLSTILKTEEKERKRFANDLHDNLGPILSTIKLYSDLVRKGDNKKLDFNDAIKNIDELTDMAISTTKEISNNITPTILHDFGLATAIKEFCNYVNSTKSVNIHIKTEDYNLNTRGIFETILFQTCKELINNTLKHALAENITIELKSNKNQVILYYKDDGIGFDAEKILRESTGLGINSIINKLKTVKATYDINSNKGEGMFILIAVKVDEESKPI